MWVKILGYALDWEKKTGKKLHKGTPYYFSSMSSIFQFDFDAAIMLMHNALDEDKRNNPEWYTAPAYSFLTLNVAEEKQSLYFFVEEIAKFIKRRLEGKKESYQSSREGSLTYSKFEKLFLKNKGIDNEVKFLFVYSVFKLWHLRRLHKTHLGDELMAAVVFTESLFPLILIIDKLLQRWKSGKSMRAHFEELSSHEQWGHSTGDIDINNRRDNDFEETFSELLQNKYRTKKGLLLQPLESDFVLVWGLRNFAVHDIKSQKYLWNNWTSILQSVFNCLFKSVDLLSF